MLLKVNMKRFFTSIFSLLLFSLIVVAEGHQPIRSFNFDIDDNILFSTARIYIWNEKLRKEIGVTTEEWAVVKNLLGHQGEYLDFALNKEAFREFGDNGIRGDQEFKHQIEQALAEGKETWKGPSWDAFVSALSNPETAAHVTLITAREHSPSAILAGLRVLYERGYLPALPRVENIFPVQWPQLPAQFRGTSTPESKAKVMMNLLDQIEAQPLSDEAKIRLGRDGQKVRTHTWGFSDDDFDNFSKAKDMLAEQVKAGRWPHVKIVLFYTGSNNPKEKSRAVVIKSDGALRLAEEEEIIPSQRDSYRKMRCSLSFFAFE